ncbi:bifunctional 5,10-methylenetetrahydrofolate dehydrogenase/5,10-methenyltetrahydrofolate cyclohydrolase [Vagococcus hydrophili]|uniref:Bifunctional protein FolD n=1 Tax=Vagococcus hydrophili TaxID=2714947 RepID=A0A6G8AWG8_9ENTE|nr:bifunctional 5,10-methylenetetrahydrofolate dehydrogenase/5,10-methenyltetrahydrofolate cyclohydrolase [Vagococcus hydrophili]QIL49441.1 bifunctional 5,10-methylenetetrahydrofolate dehydrogenase/5,10-methenyltetrahydrofolate cyclohydrolase [Vagococcus hydrophili]
MGNIIKGQDVAQTLLISNCQRVSDGVKPRLAVIRVGNHPSEISYERSVIKKLVPLGIDCVSYVYDQNIEQEAFDTAFDQINHDSSVHSILLLKPLPKHLSLDHVIQTIDSLKDVDCIGMVNMAKIYQEGPKGFLPCTAEAVLKIVSYAGIELKGKSIVMVGFGMVIGRPLTLLLLEAGSTVTVCNEYTKDLKAESSRADVLIVATGVIHLINEEHVKKDAVVIDVGINVNDKGRLVGDVNFEDVLEKAASVTPVPGGVGTVTTYVLATHVFEAYEQQK